jgi:hypothetical protein
VRFPKPARVTHLPVHLGDQRDEMAAFVERFGLLG